MRAALLTTLLLLSLTSNIQDDKAKTEQTERNAKALHAYTEETSSEDAERALKMYGVDAFPCDKEKDEKTNNACLMARQAYYNYFAKGLPRRTRAYEWNNLSTRVIFFVVLSLVAVGVYFSWKQFFGMAVKPAVTGTQSPVVDQQLPITEFEAGLGGIKVKSPILGVILLTVSLAFFYLYLKYVYPVTTNF